MGEAALPRLEFVADYVLHYSRSLPATPVLVSRQGRMAWRELAIAMEACASALRHVGVVKGDRVAVLASPCAEAIIIFLAASRIGAIWLGLNPNHTQEELSHVIADAEPSVIFAASRYRGRPLNVPVGAGEARTWGALVVSIDASGFDEFLAMGEANLISIGDAVLQPFDPLLLVYTSGTTGRPKGALLPQCAATRPSVVQNRYWGARAAPTRLINPFPISHVAFVLDAACLVLIGGGCMILQECFEPGVYLAAIETERINVIALIPTMFLLLLKHPRFDYTDFSSVELAAFGGASASIELVRTLEARFPRVSGAYGSTETAGQVLFSADEDTAEQIAGSLGRPVPEYEVRLADDGGRVPAAGKSGEIQVRGAFVLCGYWKDPAASVQAFTPDRWLKTGDLARILPDGTWRMVGRSSHAFKSGGYNIYPREIEIRLGEHPHVLGAVLTPAPDPLFGEIGVAFVELRPEFQPSESELLAWCRVGLANYKVPKRIVAVCELPRLAVGKFDRLALIAAAANYWPPPAALVEEEMLPSHAMRC